MQERERLLQVQSHACVRMAGMSDLDVLPKIVSEVSAAGRQYICTLDRGPPHDLIVEEPTNVLQHRIPIVGSFTDGCVLQPHSAPPGTDH